MRKEQENKNDGDGPGGKPNVLDLGGVLWEGVLVDLDDVARGLKVLKRKQRTEEKDGGPQEKRREGEGEGGN
jgi:hypothetical protein